MISNFIRTRLHANVGLQLITDIIKLLVCYFDGMMNFSMFRDLEIRKGR